MITTLRIPTELKRRIKKIATAEERSAHSFMLEAIAQHAERAEKYAVFLADAHEASELAHAGARTYSIDEVRQAIHQQRSKRRSGKRRSR